MGGGYLGSDGGGAGLPVGGAHGDLFFVNSGGSAAVLATGSSGQVLTSQGTGADPIWATPAGGGDVLSPASSTTNAIAKYADTTGTQLANSGVTIDASNNVAGIAGLTLTGNITVGGTVDGRDIDADGTALDGLTTGGAQALRADGSVALTGNLAVSGGVTIDGVDISAVAPTANEKTDLGVLAGGTHGDVYYVNSSGRLARLAVGTSGQFLRTNGAGANPSWATVSAGSGDVVGPASSVDNAIPLYSGTTGKLLKGGSGVTIDPTTGNVTIGAGTQRRLGRDAGDYIDFGTDNLISLWVNGAEQVRWSAFSSSFLTTVRPNTNLGADLGDTTRRWANIRMGGFLEIGEIAAPSGGGAGFGRIYTFDDGGTNRLRYVDDAGTHYNVNMTAV